MTDLDARLGRILSIGTLAGVLALAAGVILMMADGISPLDGTFPPLDLTELLPDLVALEPTAWLWLGLIMVIATPLLRVIAAMAGFRARGESAMVGISVAILVVVGVGVMVGVSGG